jgi:tetratricopeptide (TPR) repeat protein
MRPQPTIGAMAAVGHLLEAPPLVSPAAALPPALVALPGGVEVRLAGAESLAAGNRHDEALRELDELRPDVAHEPALALRHRLAEAWSCMYLGRLDRAAELLEQADLVVHSAQFEAAERAEVLFRLGALALTSGDVAEATSLFTRALETNDRSPVPSLSLAARTHELRSRCHQRQRSIEAAGRDAERALELATRIGDDRLRARALVQASLVAERQKQWLLARMYAEQALDLCTRRGDLQSTARVLNNLGGILFLLGEVDEAERRLELARATAAEAGNEADAAQATSSLAQLLLRTGRPREARELACEAAESLSGRPDFRYELGNVSLVAARALADEGDPEAATAWLDRAEATFRELDLGGELAAVLVARGDLCRTRGDGDAAAELYREAAETLQDVHF